MNQPSENGLCQPRQLLSGGILGARSLAGTLNLRLLVPRQRGKGGHSPTFRAPGESDGEKWCHLLPVFPMRRGHLVKMERGFMVLWYQCKKPGGNRSPGKAGSQVIGQHKAAVLDHEEEPGDSGEQGKFP